MSLRHSDAALNPAKDVKPPLLCWLCGRPKGSGHTPRCSVTKWGVKERFYRPSKFYVVK